MSMRQGAALLPYGYGWSIDLNPVVAFVGINIRDWRRNYSPCNSRLIAGYPDAQLIAPFMVEGASHRTVFEILRETCLIPVLEPGEGVIVNHATFEHGGQIAELIAAQGCKVIYLPPDSPDLNRPIEMLGLVEKSSS